MALPIFQRTVVDNAGNIIAGATVTVTNESTGLPASIYSDRAGTAALSNPFTTGSDGLARFYAAAGEYRIQATNGTTSADWRYQVLTGTAATRDVTTSATDTTDDRLLKVGDGGIGDAIIVENVDLSAVSAKTLTGEYNGKTLYSTSWVNGPDGVSVGILETLYSSANSGRAVLRLTTTTGTTYRVFENSTSAGNNLRGWQEILHTGNTGSIVTEDYEEGTWTVSAGSFTTATGVYTKIGDMVHVRVLINGTGSASSITGLPFTPDSAYSGQLSIGFASYCTISNSNGSPFAFRVKTLPSEVAIFEIEGTGGIASMTGSSSLTRILLEGSYRTAQ